MDLFGPVAGAHALYGERPGMFATLVRHPEGMRQQSHSVDLLEPVLKCLDRERDSYLSQALFFRRNRRAVNLWSIGTLFADLDIYRATDFGPFASPDVAAVHVLAWLADHGLPLPSLVVHSGRGLYLKWLLSGGLPQAALPRWNAVQRHLVDKLAPLGADPAARDCSRVLRVERTVNTRADPENRVVRVVHATPGADGEPIRYGFDSLADLILPYTRADLDELREARAARKWKDDAPRRAAMEAAQTFTQSTLWHARMNDIRKLAELRGGMPEGLREKALFLMVNCGRWAGVFDRRMAYLEALALAGELVPGDCRSWWTRSDISTIVKRDPDNLYRFRNDTLIRWLEITDDEQADMATIIGTPEKYRRNNERRRTDDEYKARDAARRREKRGAKSERQARIVEVRRLRFEEGRTLPQIVEATGVSRRTVWRYLGRKYAVLDGVPKTSALCIVGEANAPDFS
ncbi:MAG: replication protein [Gemmatimonadota bacterium]|nr:replication protein [Gemmatimonadota bacterium]